LLPGGRSANSPTAQIFPARVPRKGEAVIAIAFVYVLAAAGLAAAFPSTFAGRGLLWLIPVVPALVQMEIFAAAGLHVLASPTITGRGWFAFLQIATGLIAVAGPGWPRAIALTAAALMVVEISVGKLTNPPPAGQP
jgi:hypothetical protein